MKGNEMDFTINNNLVTKLNSVIDDVFLALSIGHINQDSKIFKAACEAKKILREGNTLILEQDLVQTSLVNLNEQQISFQKVSNGTVYSKEPVMLSNCLKVVELILSKKLKFSEACNIIALEKGVDVPTVRQSCCRAIGLNAYQWNLFYNGSSEQKNNIIKALSSKYPEYIHWIKNVFNN